LLRSFGTLEDGQRVDAIELGRAHGLQVEVLSYGAILRRLTYPVAGARRDLVLHFERLEDYQRDRAYVGSLVGRFGNRIAGAKFMCDGREQRLTANEGVNHLHGGLLGFGKRVWRIVDADEQCATLAYRSPAGEEGYPGTLEVTLTLLVAEHSLSITLAAHTDAPTPVNLTTFDFRQARRLAPPDPRSHPQLAGAGGYDHCWVLSRDADCACELTSPARDLTLRMLGSGPGLQFYNGQFLHRAHPRLGSGVILEPQGLPNAPNEPGFPDVILRPGEEYRAAIEYLMVPGGESGELHA
jgi:aldose 1-epimerase